jgi:hypothetical protein
MIYSIRTAWCSGNDIQPQPIALSVGEIKKDNFKDEPTKAAE